MTDTSHATQAQAVAAKTVRGAFTLGVPGNYPDSEETRLFLTPEAAGLLQSMGIRVLVEQGAGLDIDYSDEAYAAADAAIVHRVQALAADVVLSTSPLTAADILRMKKGATLLTLSNSDLGYDAVHALLDRQITMIALDRMYAANGKHIFARILDEIDGRAAILYAQEGLSFLGEGKGVLLGGMPGIEPCEVLIIGEGWRVQAAARSALNIGARVTLMDNDVSALYQAQAAVGRQLNTSVIHPKVLYNRV